MMKKGSSSGYKAAERQDNKAPAIVVVDDDKRVVELLQIALSGRGYRTFCASDGEEAIGLIERVLPDVVILDVRLPKKNGYQVCEALRSNPCTRGIPVIMISGLAEPSARLHGLRCGAEDFLTKPFSPKELLLKIQKILERVSEQRARELAGARTRWRLLQGQKRLSAEQQKLQERVERLAVVAETGRALAAAGSLGELAEQMIVAAQTCLNAGSVLVLMRDRSRGEFRALSHHGVSARSAQQAGVPAGGLLEEVMGRRPGTWSFEELDGVPGLRPELLPIAALGLVAGAAAFGPEGPEALVFVGPGPGGRHLGEEQRRDLESLCKFFSTGLSSIRRAEAQRASLADAVEFLIGTLEPEADGAGGHCHRVSRFAESIWESLHLPAQEIHDIRLAALLHELGGQRYESGPAPEGEPERGPLRCECQGGGPRARGSRPHAHGGSCRCTHGLAAAAPVEEHTPTETQVRVGLGVNRERRREKLGLLLDRLRSSHQLRLLDCLCHLGERYDGRGVPLGLRAEEIPLEARIVAVADAFDRCLCNAPAARPVERAIESLRGMSGSSLDPNLVEALVRQIVTGQVRLG